MVKGEVCKTSMQRFESARRLQFALDIVRDSQSATSSHQKNVPVLFQVQRRNRIDRLFQFIGNDLFFRPRFVHLSFEPFGQLRNGQRFVFLGEVRLAVSHIDGLVA